MDMVNSMKVKVVEPDLSKFTEEYFLPEFQTEKKLYVNEYFIPLVMIGTDLDFDDPEVNPFLLD